MEHAAATEVLVVGAGPTGLVLALWLAKAGVRVRVIDQLAEAGTTSRAIGVQARTLELYRQLGIADAVVAAGWKAPAVHLWSHGEELARGELGDLGTGLSPYPYILMYPQAAHERLLIAALAEAGVRVERPRTLVGFVADETGVRAQLDDGSECHAAYLAGCDGAHSTVRHALPVGFPGGTYEHLYYVADVIARGPTMTGDVHIAFADADFLAVFPLGPDQGARLIGTVAPQSEHGKPEFWSPTWDDVKSGLLAHLHVDVQEVRWFSSYHVHHRVVSAFRHGRVFLCGDAAHLHSPVGAQGMNTGIGDAINLAWKLAAVIGGAPATLLDTYEPERRSFARKLVRTTDRLFQLVIRDGRIASLVRRRLVPRLVRAALSRASGRRLAFELISQIRIEYRDSGISEGRVGKLHGGDRLPWVPTPDGIGDNFAALTSRAWQVHVYGEVPAAVADACEALRIPLHGFVWSDAADQAGLARSAAYVVRPDGHVGLATTTAAELRAYVTRVSAS